jgi:hypothetical protein
MWIAASSAYNVYVAWFGCSCDEFDTVSFSTDTGTVLDESHRRVYCFLLLSTLKIKFIKFFEVFKFFNLFVVFTECVSEIIRNNAIFPFVFLSGSLRHAL